MIKLLRNLWADGQASSTAEYVLTVVLLLVAAAIILGATAASGGARW